MELSAVPPEEADSGGTGLDLARLLHRSSLGDEAAFAALYDQVADRLYGLCLRVIRNPALAEETAQEVFVEIWQQAGRYEPERGSPLGWMLTIAHRRAVDRVRSEDAATRRDDADHRSTLDAGDTPAATVEVRLDQQRIRAALADLTDIQRPAIELAYFGGYTHTEVATMLDIPLGTAKTRIRDGLLRLRDVLGAA